MWTSMRSVLLSDTPHTVKYAARKRRVPAALRPAAGAPAAHGVWSPSCAPPAMAPVPGMHRGQHARALLRSFWLSIATGPETYTTALQPSFRGKGREEFTHRQSH